MAFEYEQSQALRLLESIEQGSMTSPEIFNLVDEADPTLVYFVFTWLRKRYRNDPAAEGVMGRLVELCNDYPAVTRKAKEGEADSIVAWFEDAYSYRKLDSQEFIALIVEKLES